MKSIDYLARKNNNIIISVFVRNLYFFIPLMLDALYLSKITPVGISGIGVITPLLFLVNIFQKSFSQSIIIKAQQFNTGEYSHIEREEIKKLLVINLYYLIGISILGMVLFPILVRGLNSYVWKLKYDANKWYTHMLSGLVHEYFLRVFGFIVTQFLRFF